MTDRPAASPARSFVPGLALALLMAALGWAVNRLIPLASPLLVALLVGIVLGNAVALPEAVRPGLALSAKFLLRCGVVLLGVQVSLSAIAALGWPLIVLVVGATVVTFLLTAAVARRLGVRPAAGLLIAAGCSICGAAAIAGMNGAVDAEEDEVATAIGIITLFGLIAIPVVVVTGGLLGLPAQAFGAWSGASIHEVAQVVAAAGTVGGAALTTAVVVKLTRVVMLAPLVAGVAAINRRQVTSGRRPALVPWFVIGFMVAVCVRSFAPLPAAFFSGAQIVQTLLLAMAMFGLGAGVPLGRLLRNGGRPLMVGAIASVFLSVTTLVGVLALG